MIGLQKNDPEVIPDPPVEYLKKINVNKSIDYFPLPSFIKLINDLSIFSSHVEGICVVHKMRFPIS